jgi:hypothetical protein
MKINNKILSIPPYISTAWENINSLFLNEKGDLIIILKSKEKVKIPNLEKSTLNAIFDAHVKQLEQPPKSKISFSLPMALDGMNGMESLGSIMHHNPSQSNAPNLPPEILDKITAISKIMGVEDEESIPKAEPHCNCIHCQIAKALRGQKNKNKEALEEVTDEDLRFRTWDIKQTGKKLYCVTNPLDKNENYNVFLGKPVGCTCGQKDCEHIKAVLTS